MELLRSIHCMASSASPNCTSRQNHPSPVAILFQFSGIRCTKQSSLMNLLKWSACCTPRLMLLFQMPCGRRTNPTAVFSRLIFSPKLTRWTLGCTTQSTMAFTKPASLVRKLSTMKLPVEFSSLSIVLKKSYPSHQGPTCSGRTSQKTISDYIPPLRGLISRITRCLCVTWRWYAMIIPRSKSGSPDYTGIKATRPGGLSGRRRISMQ